MGTLYIDRKGYHLKVDGDAIAFYLKGRREGIVPLNPVRRVVIAGNNTVDTAVLYRILKHGATVLFLSGRRLQFRGILTGRYHNNGLLRVRQYERSLDEGFVLNFVRDLLMKKIRNQKSLLEDALTKRGHLRMKFNQIIDTLENIARSISRDGNALDSLRGYEGAASSAYFSAFSRLFPESLGFNGRNRRPPRDPVNAMLSLCYTMLYYEIVSEIYVVGLDPTIGFYHQFEYGRDSLACDIEEPFRPAVDGLVWRIFSERLFTERDFIAENGGVYLKKKARSRFYPVYEEWAIEVRKRIQEELRELSRRVMDGQNFISE